MIPIFTIIMTGFILYALVIIVRRYLVKPNFRNKVVWITGASSGIGEYLAYEFSKLEAYLIISARNLKELERVKQSCPHPDQVQIVQLDMTNYKEIQQVTAKVLQKLQSKNQKLDIVIENAGVSMRCLFRDYHFNNHLSLENVNVHGPFRHIQCFVDHMIKNKSGHIVGVTSLSAKMSTSHRSSYAGTKSGFVALLDSLRSELYPFGISVTNIMPGYIATNLSKNALTSGQSQKLGFTDANIESGLRPQTLASTSARAIYNKQTELSVSKQPYTYLMVMLRNLCPDLVFFVMRKNAKNQMDALIRKFKS